MEEDVEAGLRFEDIRRAHMQLIGLKANILELMGMSPAETAGKEEMVVKLDNMWNKMLEAYEETKLAALNTTAPVKFDAVDEEDEDGVAKAYRDVLKEKEWYALIQELLQRMELETTDAELVQTIEEMQKLISAYNHICKLLNWKFVEEISKVSAVAEVKLLLRNALFWLRSGSLRLSLSLGKLSVKN